MLKRSAQSIRNISQINAWRVIVRVVTRLKIQPYREQNLFTTWRTGNEFAYKGDHCIYRSFATYGPGASSSNDQRRALHLVWGRKNPVNKQDSRQQIHPRLTPGYPG